MLTLRQAGWARRVVLVAITTLALVGFAAVPAGAVYTTTSVPTVLKTVLARGANTQLTLSGTGHGQSVNGYIANSSNPFDPTTGYPTQNPGAGWSAKNESFAGIIYGTPTGGGATLNLYCIDINTDTTIGKGYELGTWDEASVPNVGYVARILDEYYPNTNQPSSLTNLDQRAAAVQAAIWFFSDRFVVSTSQSIHNAVATIANTVIGEGPITQPTPPSLTVTPSALTGPAGSVLPVHGALNRYHDRVGHRSYDVLRRSRNPPHHEWGSGAQRPANMAQSDNGLVSRSLAGHGRGHSPLWQCLPV